MKQDYASDKDKRPFAGQTAPRLRCRLTRPVLLIMMFVAAVLYKASFMTRPLSTSVEGPSPEANAAFQTDGLLSSRCTKPFAKNLPLVIYGVVIDAGSTGSRIHVYKFNYCKSKSPELEDEYFEQIKPGLSHYAKVSDPAPEDFAKQAAASLEPLLKQALRKIPEKLHKCTSIIVRATAGLRLLPNGQSDAIMAEIRNVLETSYPFQLHINAVAIMTGKNEGLYAWTTVNYLLSRFDKDTKVATAAIMDLGGASTQIVFEPNFHDSSLNPEDLQIPCQIPPRSLSGSCGTFYETKTTTKNSHILYQHSYLGYGLMEARRQILDEPVVKALSDFVAAGLGSAKVKLPIGLELIQEEEDKERIIRLYNADSSDKLEVNDESIVVVSHKCFPRSKFRVIVQQDMLVILTGPINHILPHRRFEKSSNFHQCSDLVGTIFDKKECTYSPAHCSFNGIYQPDLNNAFSRIEGSEFYVFSYFYDRTRELLQIEEEVPPANFVHAFDEWSIADIKSLAESSCLLHPPEVRAPNAYYFQPKLKPHLMYKYKDKEAFKRHLLDVIYAKNDEHLCTDLTYMYHLLSTGYGLADEQLLKIRKKINGVETGWCLGAAMDELSNSVLSCNN